MIRTPYDPQSSTVLEVLGRALKPQLYAEMDHRAANERIPSFRFAEDRAPDAIDKSFVHRGEGVVEARARSWMWRDNRMCVSE